MRIRVVVFGIWATLLTHGSEGGRTAVEVAEGSTVGQVLDILELPKEARNYLTRNESLVKEEAVLADGDELRVIVPLAGG